MITPFLQLTFTDRIRDQFRSGELFETWALRYPMIFDADDLRIVRAQPGYHFFEWLTAVAIYETCGYISLIEKYETKSHPRKVEAFVERVPAEVSRRLLANGAGAPDLFSYDPEGTDWFFCEVKGPGDRIGANQKDFIAFMADAGMSNRLKLATVSKFS